jgi:hypothetical protein
MRDALCIISLVAFAHEKVPITHRAHPNEQAFHLPTAAGVLVKYFRLI